MSQTSPQEQVRFLEQVVDALVEEGRKKDEEILGLQQELRRRKLLRSV